MTTKTCRKCGETKDSEEFGKSRAQCKSCRSQYMKEYKAKRTLEERETLSRRDSGRLELM